jgi:hypothetical protein
MNEREAWERDMNARAAAQAKDDDERAAESRRRSAVVRPYVNLREAERVVVRLMPEFATLADGMTETWIHGFGDAIRWTEEDERRASAFGKAVDLLEIILPAGRVRGLGRPATLMHEASASRMREIAPHEWAKLKFDIRRGILDTPPSESFVAFPPILDVLINVEDLCREANVEIAAKADDLASFVRKSIAEGCTLSETEKNPPPGPSRKKIRDLCKTLGGPTKQGPRGPRKNRAESAA